MKWFFKYSALAVAAAFALGSCTKEETRPSTSENSLHFIINTAEDVQLRSFVENNLNGTYTPKWTNGDELAIFIGDITNSTTAPTATLLNTAKTGTTASFDGTVPTDLTEGTFLSFSPAGAFAKGYSNGTVGINLSEIQTPSSLTIDEACDVLVAKPCDFTAENGTVAINDLFFKRIFSIVKVNLKGVEALNGEKVTSFTLSAPATLTGRAAVDLSTASISQWNTENESVVAKYTTDNPAFGGENGLENTVWFVVNPTTVASGSVVTFSGETENYTFSKDVTLSKDLVFPQSQMAVINLTIGEGNYTAKTAETRIFVEGFDNVETTKTQLQPSVTGAFGTGVTEALAYTYSSDNTNLRYNNNGHSSSNPYLYLSGANDNLIISNIKISGKTALKFSYQAKTNSGSSTITINYKESSSDVWTKVGTSTADANTFDTINANVFNVSSEATSIDLQIVGSAAAIVDDLALESFVDNRTTLSAPANVSASVDAETPNKVNVSWDAVENASGYEVVLSSEGKEDIVKTSSTSPLAVAGLEYSTSYSVKVKATTTDVENYIDSEYSAAVSVITGDKPAEAAEWVSTPFANLKAGDKVVIVRTSETNYAMTNDQGTSAAPKAQAVTVVNDKLDNTPESNIVWYVGVDGSNKIFYTSSEKTSWLYCTSSNNGVRVGANTNKTFTYDSNYLKHVSTSRYLGVYNNADWRCYTSNTGNIGNQTFAFFVEQSGSSEGGSDPVKLATPEVSCTAKTETSLTFSWAAVDNASGYKVSVDGGINYGSTQKATSYTWEGLEANTTKTLYVKAIGDGINFADSDAASAEGKTTTGSGDTPSDYTFATSQSASNTAYSTNYDVTISDIQWSVPGNQQFSGYVRIGGKSLSSTVRYIYSKTALPVGYKTIKISTNGISNSSLSVESVVCKVYSSATGAENGGESDLIATMTNTDDDWAVSTAKTIVFTDESSAAGSARFYRFEFTLTNSTSKNYGIDLQKIVFSAK